MMNELRLLVGKVIDEHGSEGEAYFMNLSKDVHVLVAGTTGSGKSNLLNWVILSQCSLNRSDDLHIYLGDPKRVEFMFYEKMPHVKRIANTVAEHEAMLDEVCAEMDHRYSVMKSRMIRNVLGHKEFPSMLVIIDEFADLIMTKKVGGRIEDRLIRLVQMGRAAGITVVLATQNPLAKVVDSLIKGNCSTRICMKVSTEVNSRVVLDESGAEELPGNGRMLFQSTREKKLLEIQAPFVSDAMIVRMIEIICNREGVKKAYGFNKLDEIRKEFGVVKC